MADSLPPHASVRFGAGSRPPSRPPPGPISFPPPTSPPTGVPGGITSPAAASPGGLAPATQFTFRKGVHLPAIKSPPKVPLVNEHTQPAAAAAGLLSPSQAEPASPVFAKLGDSPKAAARSPSQPIEMAQMRGNDSSDDDESQLYPRSKVVPAKVSAHAQ